MSLLKQLITTSPPTSVGIITDAYRKSHEIDGSTVGAQTDYQFKVKVYYATPEYHAFAENGVSQPFNWINRPSAVYYNGKTYIVWQGGDNTCDPYIISYDHSAKTWSAITKVADNPLTDDDHGGPALHIDANGYLHVFYGCHGSTAMKHAKSDNIEDVSAWTVQADPTGADATYPNVVRVGSDIYLFYRKTITLGAHLVEAYIKSDDNCASWGAENQIIDFPADAIYMGGIEVIGTKIHFTWTYYDYADTKRKDVFHAYLETADGNMYSMDGTNLGATIDHTEADASCRVVNTGAFETNIASVHLDGDGYPHIIYIIDTAGGWEWKYVYWTGLAWSAPDTITDDTDDQFNYADFILTSPTDIEAYLTTTGEAGMGGDIEKWIYNGVSWVKTEGILTEAVSGRALDAPMVPVNYVQALKLVFCQVKAHDYATTDLKVYAYGSDFIGADSGEDVYLDGKCRTDFGDIRFRQELSELNYWIEEKVDGSYAIFVFKMDSIPDDPDSATIHIYYGKDDETTTSNIKTTYIIGDDFDDESLDIALWDDKSFAGGVVTEQNDRLELNIVGINRGAMVVSDNAFDISNTEIKVYLAAPVNVGVFTGLSLTSPGGDPFLESDWYRAFLDQASDFDEFTVGRKVADAFTNLYDEHWIASENTIKITYDGTTIKIYEGDTERVSEAYALGSDIVYFLLYHATGGSVAAGTNWVDNIRVRKWVDPEPTHGAWGAEEPVVWPF